MTMAMQQVTGQPTMQFRDVQASAMAAIQQGHSPVVAIMPTGGGKSMLFMLSAWAVPGGTTIVVVLLILLRQDMARRCRQLGVSCVAWDRQRPPDEAAIVLMTPESAVTGNFQLFINRLVMMRRLDPVVVDECHIIMNSQKDFQPQMAQLGQLVRARCQMVYLIATLPPQMEGEFSQRIHYPRDKIYIYRGRTRRNNMAYWVWRPEVKSPYQWEQDPSIIAFMQAHIQQAMAEIFACEAYHSQQMDRGGVLERFIQGITDVIAATNALGMGVDIPDIRVIFHMGVPRMLLDYAQESGRAGRDGQASEAIIIQPHGMEGNSDMERHREEDNQDKKKEEELVQRYMAGGGCRRVVLDGYLDGIVDGYQWQQCRDVRAEPACDQCNPSWRVEEEQADSMTSSLQAVMAAEQSPRRARGHARQWLDEEFGEREARWWQDRCYICMMGGREDQHDLYSCSHPHSQTAKQWMVQVRRKIKMPQTICHGWKGAATGCEFRGVLIPMVASMLYGPWEAAIQAAWQQRLQGVGVDIQDVEAVTKWLGQRSTHGHSQLFESFCWLRGISQEVEAKMSQGPRFIYGKGLEY
ncbi:P-loop containing nucleoside triphosphate hydrolase protein [Aspergillus similis]